MVSKKSKKFFFFFFFFFFTFLYWEIQTWYWEKGGNFFYWEWGRNSAPRDGQKRPCKPTVIRTQSRSTVKPVNQKEDQNSFQVRLFLNAGLKHCRMLQGEHSAILLTFVKLPFVIRIFVLFIFEWSLETGFTVHVHVHLFSVQCPEAPF